MNEQLYAAATEHAKKQIEEISKVYPNGWVPVRYLETGIAKDFASGVDWFLDSKMGVALITKERWRHETIGYNAKHDDQETGDQLAIAAGLYALDTPYLDTPLAEIPWPWPVGKSPDKRGSINRVRQLTIAGALIAAEIDRLKRLEAQTKEAGDE